MRTFIPALALVVLGFNPASASITAAGAIARQDILPVQAPIQVATTMCGTNGCVQVHTKQEKRRKFQTMGHG